MPVGGTLTLKVKLLVPSVLLLHVCAQPGAVPDQVGANTLWASKLYIVLIYIVS